jgi:hypothetical protein
MIGTMPPSITYPTAHRIPTVVREPSRDDKLRAAAVVRRMVPDRAERATVMQMLGLRPDPPRDPGTHAPVE